MSHELTDAMRAMFPDEREALRGLASAVDRLLVNLRLDDETLGWKNELSVSSVLDIEGKWLPLARERLGLDAEPTEADWQERATAAEGLLRDWCDIVDANAETVKRFETNPDEDRMLVEIGRMAERVDMFRARADALLNQHKGDE